MHWVGFYLIKAKKQSHHYLHRSQRLFLGVGGVRPAKNAGLCALSIGFSLFYWDAHVDR